MKGFNEMFVDMGYKQAIMYQHDSAAYLSCIVKFDEMRGTMNTVYWSLVNLKRITAIEKTPLEIKTKIWEDAKFYASGTLEKDKLMDLCRSLCALYYYIAQIKTVV